jgi:hypothetical protein
LIGQVRPSSEKDEANQSDDSDPGNRIRDDKAVPQSAVNRNALFERATICSFGHHRCLPGRRFQDKRLASCRRFGPLKLRNHLRTRDVSTSGRLRIVIFLSVNEIVQNHRVDSMLRLFDSKIESYSRAIPGLRLCMAASRCTQHNKRAIPT